MGLILGLLELWSDMLTTITTIHVFLYGQPYITPPADRCLIKCQNNNIDDSIITP